MRRSLHVEHYNTYNNYNVSDIPLNLKYTLLPKRRSIYSTSASLPFKRSDSKTSVRFLMRSSPLAPKDALMEKLFSSGMEKSCVFSTSAPIGLNPLYCRSCKSARMPSMRDGAKSCPTRLPPAVLLATPPENTYDVALFSAPSVLANMNPPSSSTYRSRGVLELTAVSIPPPRHHFAKGSLSFTLICTVVEKSVSFFACASLMRGKCWTILSSSRFGP